MESLREFIKSNTEPRELKRALAVKMSLEGYTHVQITQTLNVSSGFISKWKNIFIFQGIEGLKLGYKGSEGYLSVEQRQQIILWLKTKDSWNLGELEYHLADQYGIIFKSKQSYYELFKEAGISWKKSQKENPRFDPEEVEAKKKEIRAELEKRRTEISSGELVVFVIDECHQFGDKKIGQAPYPIDDCGCRQITHKEPALFSKPCLGHLLWGDICGYLWGKTSERVEVPIKNERERQTYFGAIDYRAKEFLIQAYDTANSENTIEFLKYLQSQRPRQKILVIWDRAKYHNSEQLSEYLETVNGELDPDQWQITCLLFAPNAPQQNPVEDIWLQAKSFLREFSSLCRSFSVVKRLFEWVTDHQIFDFPKLYEYGSFS